MRFLSPAQLTGHRHVPNSNAPREGSMLRKIFDYYKAHPGEWVDAPPGRTKSWRTQLRDFYGLDIRILHSGRRETRKTKHMLVGEWFGAVYIDYLAEKIEAEEPESTDLLE